MTDAIDIQIGSAAGGGFRLVARQFLPQPRDCIFNFFSDAFQLQTLTPAWLHFSVLTPAPVQMREGLLLDYRIKLHGLPLRWQSRISVWEPPVRFVDEQTRGPYRRWRHEHRFEPVAGGTLCHDTVEYAVLGGAVVHQLFVRPDLLKIFEFRHAQLNRLFVASSPP